MIENVLVKVKELVFPIDFYILDMEDDLLANKAQLILGKPFLRLQGQKLMCM